ncbi:MAG TPA: hypothetical protein VM262_18050 [Acidimicrobiales bacterium]|nr:hypothetical protein [Acidimicrobiales bacterium]
MASRGTSFGKRERDRAKKEKQSLKQEKRQERAASSEEDEEPVVTRSMEEVLAEVEALAIQLDEGLIDAEDFADKRAELMAQIKVD